MGRIIEDKKIEVQQCQQALSLVGAHIDSAKGAGK
jgi:hypothetical protein